MAMSSLHKTHYWVVTLYCLTLKGQCGRTASHQCGVQLLVQDRLVLDESDTLSEATRGDGLLQTQPKVY